MTPEQIDQMPAGPELDGLIETEIYNAVPLTDDEYALCKAAYQMWSPHGLQMPLIRIPLSEPDYQTKLMFRLQPPRSYSNATYEAPSRDLVNKMRGDGWRFAMEDEPRSNNVVTVTFSRPGPKGLIQASALGDTDALAISRAALKAKLKEAALNKRGEK